MVYTEQQQFHMGPAIEQPNSAVTTLVYIKKKKKKSHEKDITTHSEFITRDMNSEYCYI